MSEVETSDPLRAAADLLAWNLDKLRATEEAAGTFPSPAFWEWNAGGTPSGSRFRLHWTNGSRSRERGSGSHPANAAHLGRKDVGAALPGLGLGRNLFGFSDTSDESGDVAYGR